MMKMKGSFLVLALSAAFAGGAQAALIDCLDENGYVPSVATPDGTFQRAPGPFSGTYGAVLKAADPAAIGYLSNNSRQCTIKEVQISSKAKPLVRYIDYGVINAEECSLIASTSSIWSKLGQGKGADALLINDMMMSKIDTLVTGGKLTAAAGKAINDQAALVHSCIAPQL